MSIFVEASTKHVTSSTHIMHSHCIKLQLQSFYCDERSKNHFIQNLDKNYNFALCTRDFHIPIVLSLLKTLKAFTGYLIARYLWIHQFTLPAR